ncbi:MULTISPECIES: PTS sugar transporter subunit IIA [Rhizobium]|uniref:Protein-N(Pi)-phosphohistidine--sugar phosphotransferase n=1 Tax=Rhizobium esperanzae TaxID=1967781 RepID=A0A246E1W3_9HYPH|nr:MULTISPECIES: PTS sugar transporter subunit IIA [Rhizobium]ANK89334.1 PTS system nitrogen regulatory protein PtsN 2 [Rhizobium sp. N731]ANK94688.1 PTS system nitrogen regulatory protein PtsN 2 [Rhizobium sp. N6212]ANL00738.1 PTS system nitrogen regulatory protein PtsN 2 [Rhizobium sp. N621]ANL06859.1 PTS system nitrogen regulatory protein PtsN 2 [Rhizobium esperanzae]ANL13029.1 PTS system nitrogen regulatory protein PtsN 2 [Rhizobium sp. N1341]
MYLPNIIRPEHTFIGVSAPTKWRALHIIADKAAKAFSVDSQTILKALEAREKLGSTGIGNGIAIPHAAIDGMTSPRGLLIRFAQPLDFEAIDDVPTDIAFVLIFGENNRGEYLNVLSAIARRLQSDGVLAAMRKARTADEFYSDFIADSRA